MPIPGTTKMHRLEENVGAADVDLSDSELSRLDQALAEIEIHGERYPPAMQARVDR